MDYQEYTDQYRLIIEEADLKKAALAKEYALSKNTVKEGDIIEDHIGKILVDEIKFSRGSFPVSGPICVYYGTELKKDGTPKKKMQRRSVWQTNLIK